MGADGADAVRERAAQLRRPHGAAAADVALKMNDANARTNEAAIAAMMVRYGTDVLELGPGNGRFAEQIVEAAEAVTYTGLDWSAEMVEAASALNAARVAAGGVSFRRGSSDRMPFDDASFDRVLAVHTLYFWDRPADHLREVHRVLRPGGRLCIAFGDRGFMRELPFTAYDFTLYTRISACELLEACGFSIVRALLHGERGVSNDGTVVDKSVHILDCCRSDDAV